MPKLIRTLFERRFVRFLLVGGINTAFGYGVFALLLFVGGHYALAALLSTVAGVIFNFFTTGRLVFVNRDNTRILRFVLIYGILYGWSVLMLRLGLLLGVNAYIVGAVLLLPNAFSAYFLQKHIVFNIDKTRSTEEKSS